MNRILKIVFLSFALIATGVAAGEKSAAAVKGVRDISNQLVVQTSDRSAGRTLDDGVIAGKVKAELVRNGITSGIRINVEVRHGVVLLSGFVNSSEERKEALKVAATVDGVIDVINGMDTAPLS
jgi:hyperosmotically inducible periplasmic protein